MKWIQPDPNVFAITDKVLQLYLLAVPFNALQLMLGIYIATTGRTREFIYPNIVGNVVNVLSHYICIYHLHLGFRAAPVSITIANISIVITATLFIRFSSIYEETWHPFSRACLQEWSIYLKLAIPGIMVTM